MNLIYIKHAAAVLLLVASSTSALDKATSLRGSLSVGDVDGSVPGLTRIPGMKAACISNGGLAPWSRGSLTADQVCLRDFNPKITGSPQRVAYKCTSGANWACCDPNQVGESTEQPLQNLGTCTRYEGESEPSLAGIPGMKAACISNGGLAPWSRGSLTADQVCARDFNPKITGSPQRVAYKCTSGANWACCDPNQVGKSTEQPLQNLGTCTRYEGEDFESLYAAK